MNLSGNTILITGGTSGIGYALAAELLARGNTVLITGRDEQRLAEARAKLPGVHSFVCDQADAGAIARLCAEVTAAFPNLNMLINNAGIGLKRNLNDATKTLDDLEREIKINVSGPVQLIHLFLPHLKQQKTAAIVNVTSGLAFVPLALKPIYCATKAAMHSYTQSLRVQLAHTTVKVIELAPPAVKTDFNKGQEDMNHGPRMDAFVLACAAIKGLERDREEILPGLSKVLRVMGRFRPHMVLGAAAAKKEAGASSK